MQSKRFVKILSVILSVCFIFSSAFSAYAATQKSLNEKKARIQREIDAAEKKIEQLKDKKEETESYISTLEKKIQLKQDKIDVLQKDADELQSQINKLQTGIKNTENEINTTQKQIDEKQKAFDKTFNEYCERLRAIYISGNVGSLEVLLTSSDISSILTRSQMVRSVSEKDSEALDSLMKQMDEIEKDKAELETKRNKLKTDKASVQKDKKKLDGEISTINASKKELDNEVAECNKLIKSYNNQKSEYLETISDDKEEIAKTEAEIQKIIEESSRKYSSSSSSSSSSSTGPSSNYVNAKGSGTFCYPTDYRTISSGFYRSSGAFHGALDFPCPVGSNVYAGDSGTVIDATTGWGGGYGNRVFIDHHNGFVTIYGHNSQLLVHVGQTVKRGQLIAKSGNTGRSTGPHCHFEVRKNGTKVDPRNYL